MVCTDCLQGLQTIARLDHDQKWLSDWKSKTSFGQLRETAPTCFFCRIALNGLVESAPKSPRDEGEVNLKWILRQSVNDDFLASLEFTAYADAVEFIRVMLFEEVARMGRAIRSIKDNSTGSLEALTFLKHQLTSCQESHETCSRVVGNRTWYPTRLIELLDDGARLIETNEIEPLGPYASLSHRWGKSLMFRCTCDTLDSLKNRLPTLDLPLTFLQAFEVIRFLGIRYVWIDSICIIQDSNKDWSRESKTMMKVYQQACINIAATVSSGGESGLFTYRDADTVTSEAIKISNGEIDGHYQVVQAALDKELWDDTIEYAPLNKRGWVLQERVLSPRVAHFTADQIIWDCLQGTASETIPSGALARPRVKTMSIGHKRDSKLYEIPRNEASIHGEWAHVVNAYSSCHLTFDSDKLIAIDGIISLFEEILKTKFFCALTKFQAEIQLCWHSAHPNCAKTDIAPSWSWASIKGAVSMLETEGLQVYILNFFARVEDVSIQALHHDARVEKCGGSIFLRCFLNPVELHNESGKWRLSGDGMEHVVSIRLDSPSTSDHRSLYLVPIFDVQDPAIAKMKILHSSVHCLLLRLFDHTSGTFLRCGHVTIEASADRDTGEYVQSWSRLTSANGNKMPSCRSFDARTGYLIEIM